MKQLIQLFWFLVGIAVGMYVGLVYLCAGADRVLKTPNE